MPALPVTPPAPRGLSAALSALSTPAALLAVAAGLVALFMLEGQPKPVARWHWLDIVCEGGTAAMAALWCVLVLGARPDGRVTRLLAVGLGALALGAWTDCLDEFYRLPDSTWWNHVLEGVSTPLGMALLTLGLVDWRAEQHRLSQHLHQRERLWRDHRRYDRVTELADIPYLQTQLLHELRQEGARPCALLMLQTAQAGALARQHGPAESDRLLQALAHLLLLNLRCEDLLVRCAGDRYAIVLPGLDEARARSCAQALQAAIAALRFHTRQGQPVGALHAHVVLAVLDDTQPAAVGATLEQLGQALSAALGDAP